jgi:hypothetical protein
MTPPNGAREGISSYPNRRLVGISGSGLLWATISLPNLRGSHISLDADCRDLGISREYNDPIQDDWARRPAAIGLEKGSEKLPTILPVETLPVADGFTATETPRPIYAFRRDFPLGKRKLSPKPF